MTPKLSRLSRATVLLSAVGWAAFLITTATAAPVFQTAKQETAKKPAEAKPAAVQSDDYLVQVGKHVMWKSQVEKMHPELKTRIVRLSKANKNDFLVTVGKQTVWASTIRLEPNSQTRPATHDAACKDFLVRVGGKQPEWASSLMCPMGKHTKDAKPLCCVAPIGDLKNLPKCCQDAQKI